MSKSAAEVQAEWWARWWAADFCWAGLMKHPVGKNGGVVHGGLHGEMDLQAYWRRDPATGAVRDDAAMRAAGELVAGPDGRVWHIAHLPWHWQGGAPAKAGWNEAARGKLAGVIGRRIAAAAETVTDHFCYAEVPDGRTQLSGAVLTQGLFHPDGPDHVVHAVCDRTLLPQEGAAASNWGAGFRCEFANFSKGADFSRATFSGTASFNSATFSGYARFDSATFSGAARFDSATFSGDASFHSATFSGSASFYSATFSGHARFGSATFSGDASFDSATFSGNASFYSANFSEDASFNSATFSGYARFDSATFSGDASFYSATFSGDASFDSATFSGYASFYGATFSGDASFDSGESKLLMSFFAAKFHSVGKREVQHVVTFRGWRFSGVAEFDRARFATRTEFGASVFARLASFRDIIWPDKPANWHGMFNQAVFKDLASFQGAGLSRFAAFDGAILQGGLQLDNTDERSANATFQRERAQASALQNPEEALRQLEGGCRVLKQAMEKSANKSREQVFYAFELMARRHQRGTPWWERQFSRLYGIVADYGRSIGQPLFWLALLIPLFTAVYAALVFGWRAGTLPGVPPLQVWVECLHLSMQRVFPFGPWTLTPTQMANNPVQMALQGTPGSLFGFAIRTLGTLQSLFALALAFLAGLALRRRFQMN
ncbi:pentapeptide repeat-containing protein [Falsiroseomonas selenitidurans]|uniref:Pentapeptide repeat-containing protein n=1 Tax=Falsiroseomonas selenitidurans TaxID=2716335 RepID=A0ABX1E0I0_9PROT|nr:pentapeptide repeat-containing protein [Falsiroseomonas selenitidurans]NKC30611.1 pentapeptide repeat-containing protein [Falsiroseomonas selenitidurans]